MITSQDLTRFIPQRVDSKGGSVYGSSKPKPKPKSTGSKKGKKK